MVGLAFSGMDDKRSQFGFARKHAVVAREVLSLRWLEGRDAWEEVHTV